ncbi:hypothetical protein RSOLAG1IB_03848 [Rhizoctonia solani AG-1 IB]|uniref:Phosphatidylinositol N-acetylglucosaminyltransferase subunit H conserved domain-containing protein n=1 Tax=Thanatephorus cucumeris (strain AG1-IB / isolate 7/3/14) TaxID=1108050 RepID=A0A0B7FSH3_THACB|nr:hypothetical protein RSOLAG1IB_03848 [Rhizoctonia solani AG-1 IB]
MSSTVAESEKHCSGTDVIINSRGFQLTVLELNSGIIEYRVQRESSTGTRWRDGVIGIAIAFLIQCFWDGLNGNCIWTTARIFFLGLSLFVFFIRCTEVQHESVVAFPSIGLQLETHRGLTLSGHHVLSAGTTRHFLPISAVSDIVINEGLCGWNVRRYLAVLSAGESRLQVMFQASRTPTSPSRRITIEDRVLTLHSQY